MAVTLAICLSYIHLDRFRHKAIIRKYAQSCYSSLRSEMVGRREGSAYWKRICILAEEEYENVNASINGAQHNLPRSFWERFYSHIFMKARDTFVATIGAFVSPALLIYWTGYLMGYFGEICSCSAMEDFLLSTYILLSSVIVLMILAAYLGPKAVGKVKGQIDSCKHEIETLTDRTGQELQEKAKQSTL